MDKLITQPDIEPLRIANQVTREELSKAIGVSSQTLYRWEKCKIRVHKIFLKAISEYLATRKVKEK